VQCTCNYRGIAPCAFFECISLIIASSQFKFPLPTVEVIYNKLSGCFAAICESIKGKEIVCALCINILYVLRDAGVLACVHLYHVFFFYHFKWLSMTILLIVEILSCYSSKIVQEHSLPTVSKVYTVQ